MFYATNSRSNIINYILHTAKMVKISDPKCDDNQIYLITFKNWVSGVYDAHTYSVKSPDDPPHTGNHISDVGSFPNHLHMYTSKYGSHRSRCMPGDLTTEQWATMSECLPTPLRAAPLFDKLATKTYINKVCGNLYKQNIKHEYNYTTHGVNHDSGCAADYAWSMYTRSTGNEHSGGGHYYLYAKKSGSTYNSLYEDDKIASQYQTCLTVSSKENLSESTNYCYPPVKPASNTTYSRFFAPKGAYGMVHHKDGHHTTKHCDSTLIKNIAYQPDGATPVRYGTNKIVKKWKSKPNVTGLDDLYKHNNNKALIYISLKSTGLTTDTNTPALVCAYYIPDFQANPDLMQAYDNHLVKLHQRSPSFNIEKYRGDFVQQVAAHVCFASVVKGSSNCISPVTGQVTSCPVIMSKANDGATICQQYYDDDSPHKNKMVGVIDKYCQGNLRDYEGGTRISPVKPYCYCDYPKMDKVYNEIMSATNNTGDYGCWYAPCQISSLSLIGSKGKKATSAKCPAQCNQSINIFHNSNSNISIKAKNRIKCQFHDDNGGDGSGGKGGGHNTGGGSGGGSATGDGGDPGGSSSINSLKQLWANHSTEIIIVIIVVIIVFGGLMLLGILL